GVGSRTAAERLLAAGLVHVDGRERHKSFRVLPGMTVRADVGEPAPAVLEHDPDVPYRVAYADDALLVVDKPAGVVVHPAPGRAGGTLVQGLVGHAPEGGEDAERPGIVHRLDRDTSGLLVVALAGEAHAGLDRALRRRELEREYVALVHGRP